MESLAEDMIEITPSCELRVMEGSEDEVLVKFTKNKICSNGDRFTGHVNVVTGELISGKRIYIVTQECYEGPFLNGERHGLGVCTKLNGEGKFLGKFLNDSYHRGTLVTKDYTYVGQFSEGIFHGNGALIHSEGTLYEGNFEGGVFDGLGKFTCPAGNLYEGGFRGGMKQGHGKMVCNDGSVYIGDWNRDRKDGVGKETYDSRREYEGEYVNDKRHGKGTMKTPSVTRIGPWRNDIPLDGPGWIITYPKTHVQYSGEAVSCRPHGYGELSFRDQDSNNVFTYEGQVLCGLRHGVGRMIAPTEQKAMTWKGDLAMPPVNDKELRLDRELRLEAIHESASEDEVDGDLAPSLEELNSSASDGSDSSDHPPQSESKAEEDGDIKVYSNGDSFRGHIDIFGKRQGFGIFVEAATGMCYSGQWKSSKKHGRGTLAQPLSGVQYIGTFIEDVMEGHGSLRFPDGSKYTGKIRDGMMHGKGNFQDATNETVYTGDFVYSMKHGDGEEEYADGGIFCGPFVSGKRSGKDGCLYHKTRLGRALVYRGEWLGDSVTGRGKRHDLETPCPGSHVGAFRDGNRHGHGAFTTKDGYIYEGEWLNDTTCDGDWVITCPRGAVYYGSALCKNGIPIADGFGTRNENDGTFYSGGFRMGQRHGSGLCVFSSGDQWDGRWDNGVFVKYGRSRP
jgi:hypothetical protein